MSVIPLGEDKDRPTPRYIGVQPEWSIYWLRPRCGQPRPQPHQRPCQPYRSAPTNAPLEKPCSYDYPCKADCFNQEGSTRPSGRYASTVKYPGEIPPKCPPCQAYTCPSPPFHPCCYHTCNKIV